MRMFEKVEGSVTELAGPQTFKVATEGMASMTAAETLWQKHIPCGSDRISVNIVAKNARNIT